MWGKSHELNTYWVGKKRYEPDDDHLLLWHMLDVAVTAEALWDHYVGDRFKDRFELGRQWFAFLAAAHDTGKATSHFQHGDNDVSRRFSCPLPKPVSDDSAPHELTGAVGLANWLKRAGVDATVARDYGVATNVLHGRFIPKKDFDWAGPYLELDTADGQLWERHRNELLDEIAAVLDVPLHRIPSRRPPLQVVHELAGLVKLADWLASPASSFTYTTERLSAADYVARVRPRAVPLLDEHQLRRFRVKPNMGFGDMFRDVNGPWTPGDMQSNVHEMISRASEPSMLVVEDEMGRGKTEAALWAAYDLLDRGLATGLYFALPTQATARSQHVRAQRWVSTTAADDELVTLNIGGNRDEPATFAERWASRAHRGLLPRIGVGTVDQVLLGAMPIKYGQSRVAGLGGRVVIFDEVHAYDTYQLQLLKTSLKWLAYAGAHVIILSATLPLTDRAELLNAFQSGLEGRKVDEVENDPNYPLVTGIINGERTHSYPAPGKSRTVKIHSIKHSKPEVWLRQLRDEIVPGETGVIGIICNSVRSAVDVYDQIHRIFPEVTSKRFKCLHARFTVHGRRRIEDSVLSMVGREGIHLRSGGLTIIIGTQVLEQSLDIDFDLLVTEFAPIDLLFQRIGRVHRFGKDVNYRPRWAPEPVVWVIEPPQEKGVPNLDPVAYVYSQTQPTALLATWQEMHKVQQVTLPDDIPVMVRSVYDDLAVSIDNIRRNLHPLWREMKDVVANRDRSHSHIASSRSLGSPWIRRATHSDDFIDDNIDFASRLGEPTIEVVPVLRAQGDTFIPAVDITEGGEMMPWTQTKINGGWGDQIVRMRLSQVADFLDDPSIMPIFGWDKGEYQPGDPAVKAWRRTSLSRARLLVVSQGSPAQYYQSKGLLIQGNMPVG